MRPPSPVQAISPPPHGEGKSTNGRGRNEDAVADPDVLQLLGRIDGKLDQVIDAAKEHREDDKRRFSDVYSKLGEHDQEIAKAKGAKGVILWLAGGGALAISALVSLAVKAKGG